MGERIGLRAAGMTLLALAMLTPVLFVLTGSPWHRPGDHYALFGLVTGLILATCGVVLLASARLRLLALACAAGGAMQLLAAACIAAAVLASRHQMSGVRGLETVAILLWAAGLALALPLSVSVIPDRRGLSRVEMIVLVAMGASAAAAMVGEVASRWAARQLPRPYIQASGNEVWVVLSRWMLLALIATAIATSGLRLRTEVDAQTRRETELIIATALALSVIVAPCALVAHSLSTFALALLWPPVVRARASQWRPSSSMLAVVTDVVLVSYVVLLGVAFGLVSAAIVGLVAFPLRVTLQRAFAAQLYGNRDDALRVASHVGDRLTDLAGALEDLRFDFRLPWVCIEADSDVIAEAGVRPARVVERALGPSARLLLGLPAGAKTLTASTQRALDLLVGPLTVATN